MNSPMREAGPGQTPGSKFTEDPLPRQRPPAGPADGPADGLVVGPADRPVDGPAEGPMDDPANGPVDQPSEGVANPPGGTEGLVRASGVMAAGTLVSRVTGFMRTAAIAYALGTLALADAYNNANTFPNAVFDLLLGGILTSVFVPLLVNAAKRDADRGRAYDQRMFTLVTITLAVITFVATLAAPVLVTIYAHSVHGPERALMVTFARFFIPQIFFYGICALAGAILNARGRFAAPMWTPVVNNIVVIFVITLYMITAGTGVTVSTITPAEVRLLGIGTTLGIIAQAAAMIPALRRVGFRWRPQLGLSRDEIAEIWRMAGWMFGYVVTTQIALLVTQNLANDAAVRAEAANIGYGAGFSAYQYGWLLFQLPYADRGHLGDHRAAAAHERACGGRQVFACQAGLLRRCSAGIRSYGSGRCRARGARALAGCPAARARQHIGCRRHFRR